MKNLIVITVIVVISRMGTAQVLTGASGGSVEAEQLRLSWSIGEPVVGTISAQETFLNVGFQQPSSKLITALELSSIEHPIDVFPNPAVTKITVKGIPADIQQWTIVSYAGQTILTSPAVGSDGIITIDVSEIPSGAYILVLQGKSLLVRPFIKQ